MRAYRRASGKMRLHKRGVYNVVQEGLTPWMFDREGESSIESWMQKVDEGDGSVSVQGGNSESEGDGDSHGDGALDMHEHLSATAA